MRSQLDAPAQPTLGAILKQWRDLRGTSQLELSFDTGTSQRQISFIESGRSVPKRETLMDIADALGVPQRERNTLLLAAGYAPMFSEAPWDDAEMRAITMALKRMLAQHDPFPAIVMDRYWNVLMVNDGAMQFFGQFVDVKARKRRNMLHLLFDPNGLRPFVVDWQTVARSFLQRVRREATGQVVDHETMRLTAELLAYPSVENDCAAGVPSRGSSAGLNLPMLPIGFHLNGAVLNYFSMVTTVGTPVSVAAQELRIESMFPADEETERLHRQLLQDAPLMPRHDER